MTDPARPTYRYADPGDQLTSHMIARSGLSDADWESQESAVLSVFYQRLAGLPKRDRLLDLGSGHGRLSLRAAGLFDLVISVEPDEDRAREQAGIVAASPNAGHIKIYLSPPALAGTDPHYDAAICSHVLQHVDAATAAALVADLSEAVRGGGLLILLAAFSGDLATDRHAVDALDPDGRFQELATNQAEFTQTYHANAAGRLPIHFFSLTALYDLLRANRFTPSLAYGFHGPAGVVGPLPTDLGGEFEMPGGLSSCRDIAILAVRQ